MALNRTVVNSWVDDDGSNTVGDLITKSDFVAGILDPVDAEIVAAVAAEATARTAAIAAIAITPMTLLKANSGTSTAAGATTVDSVAITGLTGKDTLKVFIDGESETQATAGLQLYHVTDGANMLTLFGSMAAGVGVNVEVRLRQAQGSNLKYNSIALMMTLAGALTGTGGQSTRATAWTGSWSLGIRHTGVTAGGTFRWSWSVYKLAGQ
jgi:hypothetical protein